MYLSYHIELEMLKGVLFQWSGASGNLSYYGKKDGTILKDYVRFQHDLYQNDQFDSNFELLPKLTNVNLSHVTD